MSRPLPRHRTDTGSITLAEVLIASLIAAILTSALSIVMWSAARATGDLRRRAEVDTAAQRIDDVISAMAGGAATSAGCVERLDPTTAASLTNCRHLALDTPRLVSATATELCVLTRPATGISAGADIVAAPDRMCLEVTAAGRLLLTTTPPDDTSAIPPTYTAVGSDELLVSGILLPAGGSPFTYFDADGSTLSPTTGTPAALTAEQRLGVHRIRLAISLTTSASRLVIDLSVERRVGGGQ